MVGSRRVDGVTGSAAAGSIPSYPSTIRWSWDVPHGRTGMGERSMSTAVPEFPVWCAARPSPPSGMWAAISTGVQAEPMVGGIDLDTA